MSNEFPKMLFRCPGPMAYEGATFDTIIVANADEEAVAEGWHSTTTAAKAAHEAAPVALAPESEAIADPAPPVEAEAAPVAKTKKG